MTPEVTPKPAELRRRNEWPVTVRAGMEFDGDAMRFTVEVRPRRKDAKDVRRSRGE